MDGPWHYQEETLQTQEEELPLRCPICSIPLRTPVPRRSYLRSDVRRYVYCPSTMAYTSPAVAVVHTPQCLTSEPALLSAFSSQSYGGCHSPSHYNSLGAGRTRGCLFLRLYLLLGKRSFYNNTFAFTFHGPELGHILPYSFDQSLAKGSKMWLLS